MDYMSTNKIEEKLSKELKPERYRHTLGVAYTAASMAMVFDIDIHKAYRAGLLHDCAKGYSIAQQKDLCEKYGILIDQTYKDSPQLIHSALAPYVAREYYGEQDPEILNAIECHTTGKPAMSILEKIVFIADYMEPNRKDIPGLKEVRKLAFLDLDVCVFQILENTIGYLNDIGQSIGGSTMETHGYYKSINDGKKA